MNKKLKVLLIVIFIFSLHNMFSQYINNVSVIPENAFIYSLPKTSLLIEIQYVVNTYNKGIYSKYTKEFLGYEPEIKENKTTSYIIQVRVKSVTHIDYNQFYFLSPEKGNINYENIKQLEKNELIFTGIKSNILEYGFSLPEKQKSEFICHTIPYEGLLKDKIDTVYKKEFRDSGWVNVPYYKRKYLLKDEEDYAKEAAHLLIWLNDQIIKGSARLNPEDEYNTNVSEVIYDQTIDLIHQYRALFSGYQYTDTFTYKTIIIPELNKERYHVASFNENKGITKDKSDNPIFLNISLLNNSSKIDTVLSALNKYPNRLFYRIPAEVTLSINLGNLDIYNGIGRVYQYGILMSVPSKMVIDK